MNETSGPLTVAELRAELKELAEEWKTAARDDERRADKVRDGLVATGLKWRAQRQHQLAADLLAVADESRDECGHRWQGEGFPGEGSRTGNSYWRCTLPKEHTGEYHRAQDRNGVVMAQTARAYDDEARSAAVTP